MNDGTSSLPSWLVRVMEPAPPVSQAGEPPDARLSAPADPGGAATVAIEIWADPRIARLGTAEAGGRAVILLRHPTCLCGGDDEARRLLDAFERTGSDVFTALRGEAVLILWDASSSTLEAARAAGSTRPLFFAAEGAGLVLSDSIDTLTGRGGISATVNRELLVCHLADRWHRADETYFSAVSRVPPAHALRWRKAEATLWQFWDPLPVGEPVRWIDEDVPELFAALFEQAVARAIGPRRTGVFLSGGLDSVSVAVAAADLVRSRRGEPLLALSLAMPHPDCDEREVQAGVANGLGLEQRLIDFDDALAGEGLIERALELSAEWPAPLQNFWIAAYIGLARAGRDGGCRAILTGNGGDEWLGVSPFLAGDALRRLQLRRWYRLWRVYDRSYRVSRLRLLARHAWTFGMRPLVAAAFWSAVGAVSPKARASWRHRRRPLPPWLAPDPGLRRTLRERDRAAWEAADSKPREDAYVVHCREPIAHPLVTFELDEIAEHGRRAGVLFRQPYFDPDLVTFLARVRPEELMQGGRSKGLVRDEVARRCPDLGFRQQRKVLGTNLFEERMRREVEALWRQLGGPTTLAALEIVDGHKVEYLREGIRDGGSERRALYRLWSLLSAEVWVRSRVGE